MSKRLLSKMALLATLLLQNNSSSSSRVLILRRQPTTSRTVATRTSTKEMATQPQSDGQTPFAVEGEATATSGFTPRGSDLVVAVMGVTGAGKSTFISKCVAGPDTPAIGHDIESCRWLLIFHLFLMVQLKSSLSFALDAYL